ncbi:MAG: efflux RND transporter periplasmic adaptor subunit [Acidobacteriota bacterium]
MRSVRTARRSPALVAITLCGVIAACSRRESPPPAAAAPALVTVQAATVQTLRDTIAISGTVVPAAAGDFMAIAPEAARIAEVTKSEGEKFEAGEMLVRFEISSIANEIETRERELDDATTRAAAAKAEETRLESLHERGVISRNAYETAKSTRLSADSALSQAKAHMETAKLLQERTIVRARFAGLVLKRWHNPGDLVAGGPQDPVLRAVDPTRVQVAVDVSRAQLGRVLPGQPGTVQTGADPPQPATVVVRPTPVEGGPDKIEVRLAAVGAFSAALDSPVQVEIVLEERPQAIVIPTTAVVKSDQTAYVMVAGSDGRAHRRDVQLGLQSRGLTQVVSGLQPGEQVIVGGLDTISDGAAIRAGTG